MKNIDTDTINKTAINSLVKVFTAEELKGLADLYSLSSTEPFPQKMAHYRALITPSIMKAYEGLDKAAKIANQEVFGK